MKFFLCLTTVAILINCEITMADSKLILERALNSLSVKMHNVL